MALTHHISISVQALSKPVHAARARIGPDPNHGTFAAKPSSHHVHVTLRVTAPTSLCPTFLLTQNLCASAQRLSFLRRVYDVTKSALYHLKG